MENAELIKALRDEDNCNVLDYIDAAADALEAADIALADCRNELCLKCGKYRTAHEGSCDGCRWKKGE